MLRKADARWAICCMMAPMSTEALVQQVKQILALAKVGKTDEAYAGYAQLFQSPDFATFPADKKRQAIKLAVNIRVAPNKPPSSMVDAYRAAMRPLEAMIQECDDPADYELFGICCVITGDEHRAADFFRKGLELERGRNPQSNLCGSLMKWVASV